MTLSNALITLFEHNRWANLRLLERCAMLTPEQLESTTQGAFSSIRHTLEHIVNSEQSYLSRISTGKKYLFAEDAPPLTIAQMIEMARNGGAGLIQWADKFDPSEMVEIDWEGTPRNVPKTIILTQALQHSAEHRGQVMTIMTQLGIEPPDLQGWAYFDELYNAMHK